MQSLSTCCMLQALRVGLKIGKATISNIWTDSRVMLLQGKGVDGANIQKVLCGAPGRSSCSNVLVL